MKINNQKLLNLFFVGSLVLLPTLASASAGEEPYSGGTGTVQSPAQPATKAQEWLASVQKISKELESIRQQLLDISMSGENPESKGFKSSFKAHDAQDTIQEIKSKLDILEKSLKQNIK